MGQHVRPGEVSSIWDGLFSSRASNVVATQWPVEMNPANKLTLEFHRQLLAQKEWQGSVVPKARALQAAVKSFLSDSNYQHPYYWAAFETLGMKL